MIPAALHFAATASPAVNKPNFVWLHVESTDGRTYQDDMADLVPIPRIRSLMNTGTNFVNTYANVPICCPSRASTWAGREGHNMPHTRADSGMHVNGAWNNNEGFGDVADEFDTKKISDRLQAQANYTINIIGKEDWLTGDHSMNTMLDSFTIYSRWPYNIPEEGGFHVWGDCGGNVSINNGTGRAASAHQGDWSTLDKGVAWLKDMSDKGAVAQQPFFFYQGMVIVHPPYHTDEGHWDKINPALIDSPIWPAMSDESKVHACDLQESMKKGCARAIADLHYLNTSAHKVGIRRAYYAMIAEFDDMVGDYIDAVALSPELEKRTVFIVSSDHGDMTMEHLQFYKMAAFEGSTRVPMVISGPGVNHVGDGNVHTLVTLADIMPTLLDLAGLKLPPRFEEAPEDPMAIDGYSLVPLLEEGDAKAKSHRDFIISQFHGENAPMSWFMIRRGEMKLIQWGTGKENVPQLFNLTHDPNEWNNLALHPTKAYAPLIAELDALMKTAIDYPEVARDVARYNIKMARWWTKSEPHWRGVLNGTEWASQTQPGHGPCTNYSETKGRCSIGEGENIHSWGDIWSKHNDWYFAAWDKLINVDTKTATDAELIPACPDGPERLVHNWGK